MATIRIDADTLRTNAQTITGYKDTHDTNIQAVKSLIQNMCNSDVFDGATASAYLARMQSYEASMQAFSQMLEEFSTSLTSVANTFEQTDTSLAGALG